MSSMALVEGPRGVVGAWDTDGQVYFTEIKPGTTEFTKPRSAPGVGILAKNTVRDHSASRSESCWRRNAIASSPGGAALRIIASIMSRTAT